MKVICETCGEEVIYKGLVIYSNLDGTLHIECFKKTHKIVRVQ